MSHIAGRKSFLVQSPAVHSSSVFTVSTIGDYFLFLHCKYLNTVIADLVVQCKYENIMYWMC